MHRKPFIHYLIRLVFLHTTKKSGSGGGCLLIQIEGEWVWEWGLETGWVRWVWVWKKKKKKKKSSSSSSFHIVLYKEEEEKKERKLFLLLSNFFLSFFLSDSVRWGSIGVQLKEKIPIFIMKKDKYRWEIKKVWIRDLKTKQEDCVL